MCRIKATSESFSQLFVHPFVVKTLKAKSMTCKNLRSFDVPCHVKLECGFAMVGPLLLENAITLTNFCSTDALQFRAVCMQPYCSVYCGLFAVSKT